MSSLEKEDALRRAVQDGEADLYTYLELYRIYVATGNRERAFEALQAGSKKFPRSIELLFELGNFLSRNRQFEKAEQAYLSALEVNPSHVGTMNNLSTLLKTVGRLDEAESWCRKGLDLVPDDYSLTGNLGNILLEQGRVDEAIDLLARATSMKETDQRAFYNLGRAVMRVEDYHRAISCFRRAGELDPGYTRVHHLLALALYATGELDEAIKVFRDTGVGKDYRSLEQLLALRELCSGNGRETYESRASRKPASVGLVTYFTELEKNPMNRRSANDYFNFIKSQFKSAVESGVNDRFLLTCTDTKVPDSLVTHLIRYEVAERNLTNYARFSTYFRFMEDDAPDFPMLLLDNDIVVLRDPGDIFEEDFDVGLTYRTDLLPPINAGVVMVRNRNVGTEFFRIVMREYDRLLELSEASPEFGNCNFRIGLGDQLALSLACSLATPADIRKEHILVEGLKVRLFPSNRYNYTPLNEWQAAHTDLSDKYLLHFKGNTKKFVNKSWAQEHEQLFSHLNK